MSEEGADVESVGKWTQWTLGERGAKPRGIMQPEDTGGPEIRPGVVLLWRADGGLWVVGPQTVLRPGENVEFRIGFL